MHRHDTTRTPLCTSHGKICCRPSVESFSPAEQAHFDQFCGALLSLLCNEPSAEETMKSSGTLSRIGLD